ncbi:MAG: glycosyltransferase family 8 protein [Elusimicrobiaceae bacterium]|nr:glycosyltransferase family 8 protein [Elusimicrobiaceae bacterium]
MQPINICFVTDDKYAPYTGAAMYSVIKNLSPQTSVNFYIFDNNITEETKGKLKALVPASSSIIFVNVSSKLAELDKLQQTIPHITKTSYLKFFIADLLPKLDKIIYLDGDLIVTDDITPLWNTHLEDKLLAAVEDVGYTYWCKHNPELKLQFKCMNSGVMLINCQKWRETNLSAKLLACAKEHDKVGFGQDQPVLNYVCRDQIVFLPFYWNAQDTFFRDEIEIVDRPDIDLCHEAKNFPKIVHYTYVKKPWNYPFMRKADVFWEYYAESGLCPNAMLTKYKNLRPLIFSPVVAAKLREYEINTIQGRAYKFLIVIAFLRVNSTRILVLKNSVRIKERTKHASK